MTKAHSPINWENEPSFNTPINETNLNKMDSTIGILDDRIIAHDTSKLDKSTANTMVKDISFNENNGVFTVTRLNGSTFTIDTRLEKIAINFKYDYSTQKLIVTLIDGTTQSIDMSALLTQYEFEESNQIGWEVTEDGKVKAKILDGSITEDMLQPNYLAEIKVETEKSAQSMANAKTSENNAKQSELNAKASEEQALEYSNNAQPLAQSVSGNNPTASNSTDGSVIYLKNDGYTSQDGEPTPTTPIRISANGDKGYFDGVLLQGSRSSNNGSFVNSSLHVTSANRIECKENDIVKVSYEEKAVMSIIFYDENMNHVSGSYIDNENYEYEQTAPKNAKYVYFNIYTGATLTPSTAKHICVTINGNYVIPVKTCNSNIMPMSSVGTAFELTDNNTIKTLISTVGHGYGTKVSELKLEVGKTYKVSLCMLSKPTSSCSFTSYIDNVVDNNSFTNINTFDLNKIYTKTYTPTKDCTLHYTAWGNSNMDTFEFQLWCNEDEVRDYEHHTEIVANIPVSAPFYEGDYIEVYADGSGREYRKMKRKVVSNVGSGEFYFSANNYIGIYTNNEAKGNSKNIFSNMYKNDGTTNNQTQNNIFTNSSGAIIVCDKRFSTVNEFNDWIAESPITIVYELATPTSTPLTAEQVAEFMKLQTYEGVTHVTADGEVVMRYYCDNASGETVSMLQGMVEETKEAVSKVENLGNAFEVFDVNSASISVSSGQTSTIMLPLSADGYSALGVVGASSDTDGVDIGGVTMDIDRVTAYVKVTNNTSATKSAKVTIQVLYIK